MKIFIAKVWEFIFGYDHRRWFPEKWDLSEVHVWKEYGGNEEFINFYKTRSGQTFINGMDVNFYNNSFKIINIIGYSRSGICCVAINKKRLARNLLK